MNVRKSLLFSFSERYCRMAIQIAATMILSRLLTPRDIGIISIGLAVVGLTHVLRDLGVTNYLMQEKELTHDRLRTTFGLTLASSWLMGIGLAVMSGVVSRLYSEPGVRSVMLVLSLNFFLIPFGSVIMVMLRREGNFRAVYWISFPSAVVYSVTSVTLAAMGWGFMSMAWASVVGVIVTVTLAYLQMPSHLTLLPSFSEWRRITDFAVFAVAANLVAEMGARGTELIVGRIIGVPQLGIYTKAAGLGAMFNDNILGGVWPVALTKFAAQHRSNIEMRTAFLNYIDHVTVIAWPFFVYSGLMLFYIIRFLFGDQWDAAVGPGRILCIAGFVSVLASLTSAVLTGKGANRPSLWLQLVVQSATLTLVVVGCFGNLKGVAYALIVAAIINVHISFVYLRRLINVSFLDVVRTTSTSFLIALVTALPPLATLLVVGDTANHIVPTLFVSATVTALAWLAAVAVLNHPIKEEVVSFCVRAYDRLRRSRPAV